MAGLLQEYKIAKWPVLTVIPIYYRPSEEAFIKPTTAKGVIEYFELTGLKYSARPTFEFYQAYREQILLMKQEVAELLRVDNAAFCGFLMNGHGSKSSGGCQRLANSGAVRPATPTRPSTVSKIFCGPR